MAITKVGTYRNPPEDITDYEAIVAHLEAYTRQIGNQGMILTEWTNTSGTPAIAMGSYISHGGVLYVVDTEDYALPALSSDGTYYLRVAASGETLTLDYITDLTGYVWNAIYNGLYHSDGKQVLPYQVVKNGALVEKWKITNLMQGGGFSMVRYDGAIKATSVDTGHGANELYPMNQAVRTTDNVNFANLNPPVNNNDNVMPDIGIGGFTFGWVSDGNITLPPFGTIMVIAFRGNAFAQSSSGIRSGGSVLGFVGENGYVFAWRIA